jgi:CubicO group peptidase (beta-lactamase class C family)
MLDDQHSQHRDRDHGDHEAPRPRAARPRASAVADDVVDGLPANRTPVCPLHDTLAAMTAGTALGRSPLPVELQDLVSSLAGAGEPGFAVGIYSAGELVTAAAAGCAICEHEVPLTEHTVFEIASVSKHITSACLLLLASDGLISLDRDIRAWLPELELRQPVTLRQCLTHSAGLRDYLSLCEVIGVPVLGLGEDRAMNLITGLRETDFPPGSAFSYSNTGYVLAAALVRRITGVSLAQFAGERVFGPLGMTASGFRDDVGVPVQQLAGGYLATPAKEMTFRRHDVTETVVGDGGCVTSLADLAGWHGFMASGAVLGTQIRDGLFAGQVLNGGKAGGYGLGLAAIEIANEAAWWHSGSWAGYRTAVIYLPARGVGVSVLANRNDKYASHIAAAAANALVTGTDVRACYASATGIPAPPEQASGAAAEVAGLWHAPALDLYLEFRARDGEITAPDQDAEPTFRLGTDGRWHGIGIASGATFTRSDDALAAGWGLLEGLEDRFVRADATFPGASAPRLPSGHFFNEELTAYATTTADDSLADETAAAITIGLAAPRKLVSAGDGVWRAATGGALTVPLAPEGSSQQISVPGAHHLAFSRAADPGDLPIPRGLRSS